MALLFKLVALWEAFVQEIKELFSYVEIDIVTVGGIEPLYISAMFSLTIIVLLFMWGVFKLIIFYLIIPFPAYRNFLTPLQHMIFENIVAKGRCAHNKQFLLLPQCFQLY